MLHFLAHKDVEEASENAYLLIIDFSSISFFTRMGELNFLAMHGPGPVIGGTNITPLEDKPDISVYLSVQESLLTI